MTKDKKQGVVIMTKDKKQCGNCIFFKRHYVVSRGKFIELNFGHCKEIICKKLCNENDLACRHWKQQEDLKKENIEYIEKQLKEMAKQINLFAEYFENMKT